MLRPNRVTYSVYYAACPSLASPAEALPARCSGGRRLDPIYMSHLGMNQIAPSIEGEGPWDFVVLGVGGVRLSPHPIIRGVDPHGESTAEIRPAVAAVTVRSRRS